MPHLVFLNLTNYDAQQFFSRLRRLPHTPSEPSLPLLLSPIIPLPAPFILPICRSVDICTFCNLTLVRSSTTFFLSFSSPGLPYSTHVCTDETRSPRLSVGLHCLSPLSATHPKLAENLILAWPFLHPPDRKFMRNVSSVRLRLQVYAVAPVRHPEHPSLRHHPAFIPTLVHSPWHPTMHTHPYPFPARLLLLLLLQMSQITVR